jgi:hypothetical protein
MRLFILNSIGKVIFLVIFKSIQSFIDIKPETNHFLFVFLDEKN